MRDHAVPTIIPLFLQVLQNYTIFTEDVVNNLLEVLAQLIDWNNLALFENFVPIFRAFL